MLAGALAIVGLVAITRRAPPPPPRSLPVREVRAVRELAIPNVGALPKLDGELDDAIWHLAVARTGPFLNEQGAHARPYSDARIAWGHDHLILALYAGDEDIRTSGPTKDLFRVTLGTTTFEASATGELAGAPPGTRVGHDVDGTPDNPVDDDEEWVLELVIPLRSVGLDGKPGERLAFAAERCDTTRDGVRRCGATPAMTLVLATTPPSSAGRPLAPE